MPTPTAPPARLPPGLKAAAGALAGGALLLGVALEREQERALIERADLELAEVATFQAGLLATWHREQDADAALVGASARLSAALAAAPPAREAAIGAALPVLRALREHGYRSAALLDRGGALLAALPARGDPGARERALAARALRAGRPVWSSLDADGGRLRLDLAVPILRMGEDRPPGIVLLSVDPEEVLRPTLATWHASWPSAEALLVRADGADVVFLSGLPGPGGAREVARRPLARRDLAAAEALRGATGPGPASDPRGAVVRFAARPVAGTDWFLVAEVDPAEIVSTTRFRSLAWLGSAFALLAVALLAVTQWWRLRALALEVRREDAERARDRLAAELEGFARFANDAVLLLAEDGRILDANDRAAELYGRSRDELRQLAIHDLRAPETRGSIEAQLAEARRPSGTRFETTHLRADGSSFPVEVSARVIADGGRTLWQSVIRDVGARRAAERALRESEQSLSVTLRSIGDAVIATDREGRVTRMNPVAEELTRWPLADAAGRPLAEIFRIVNEQTRAEVESPAARVLREGRILGLANHTVLIGRDGSERPIADSGAPIRGAGGELQGVVLVFRDVTEQQASERIQAYQAALLGALEDAVVGIDPAARITSWQAGAERLLGWSEREAVGRDFAELLGIDPLPGVAGPELLARSDRGERLRGFIRPRRRDGGEAQLEAAWRPLRDGAGQATGLVGTLRDVGDRLRAEEAARLSEQKFRIAFHRAGFGVILTDREGRILEHNLAFRELLGYGEEQLARVQVGELNHPEDRERSRTFLADVVGGRRETFQDERRYRRADGSYTEVHLRVSPIRDADGAIAFTLGIIEDVAERRQLERRLLATERLASMGMLAAGVTHEINNPLSFISGNLAFALEALGAGRPPSPEVIRALREAADGADRIRDIVRDVRVFSRENSADGGTCDVGAVLRSAANVARNELRHRAELVLEMEPVPPAAASAHRLGQVLLNVLVNAAQAIEPGSPGENQIRVRVSASDGAISVEVRDTGRGVSADVRERLFQPFTTTKPPDEGTGLGLFISREIVRALGGAIDLESQPGRGTTVRIAIPAALPGGPGEAPPPPTPLPPMTSSAPAPPPGESPPPSPPQRPPPSPDPDPPAARVLVVDDEPLVARALSRFLSPPHQVVIEGTGAAALARLAADPGFDVIFCDLMMPGMTGMELYSRLAQLHPELVPRLVFVTGGAFTAEARRFVESSAVPVLEKPFDRAGIRALVERVIVARPGGAPPAP